MKGRYRRKRLRRIERAITAVAIGLVFFGLWLLARETYGAAQIDDGEWIVTFIVPITALVAMLAGPRPRRTMRVGKGPVRPV